MAAVCAWSYVGRVVEISCATPRQAKKNNAKPKSKWFHLHSCGVP
jgi:hypothetical protein